MPNASMKLPRAKLLHCVTLEALSQLYQQVDADGIVLSGASICDPSDKLFRCGPAKLNGPLVRLLPDVTAL